MMMNFSLFVFLLLFSLLAALSCVQAWIKPMPRTRALFMVHDDFMPKNQPLLSASSNGSGKGTTTTSVAFTTTHATHPDISDQQRRRTTLTTVAMLAIPLLRESVPEMNSGGAMERSMNWEEVLEGDAIVRNLWLARLSYPVLVVSLEVGLFTALQTKPLTHLQLAQKLHIANPRVMQALVAVLVSLGLLQTEGESIRLTPAARHVLLPNSPYYWGPQLLAADGTTTSLRRAIRRTSTTQYQEHSDKALESFIDSMQAHGTVTATATAHALDLSQARSVLDMAGGSGCFAHALQRKWPHLQVILADLGPVIQLYEKKYRRQHFRIQTVPANLFEAATWPTNCDVHLLANVLHDWDRDECIAILRGSRQALEPQNGQVVVVEQLLNPDLTGPLPAALASVSMLLGDWRTGKQYSFQEIQDMMMAAGFGRVELGPKCGKFHTAVIGHV
jgi:acetylserotonin N-methyltransferase